MAAPLAVLMHCMYMYACDVGWDATQGLQAGVSTATTATYTAQLNKLLSVYKAWAHRSCATGCLHPAPDMHLFHSMNHIKGWQG